MAALIALLYGLLRLGPALNAPFLPKTAPSEVSTDPANLPYYAVRSLLRMFVALLISLIFTFVYATAAARLRRAEKVLIPVLDILQSVPVLGFLAVTVTAFINLFPGSELGLEAASASHVQGFWSVCSPREGDARDDTSRTRSSQRASES